MAEIGVEPLPDGNDHAEEQTKKEQRQHVVHHAGGHHQTRHPGFMEAQVAKDLEGNDHGRGRHGKSDEDGGFQRLSIPPP